MGARQGKRRFLLYAFWLWMSAKSFRTELVVLIDQISWLDGIGDFSIALAGVPASKKLRLLAMQAMARPPRGNTPFIEKRYTLIVALPGACSRVPAHGGGTARGRSVRVRL